jgi:hypothetical protein
VWHEIVDVILADFLDLPEVVDVVRVTVYLHIVNRRSLPVVACGLSGGFIPVDRRRRGDSHCGRDL